MQQSPSDRLRCVALPDWQDRAIAAVSARLGQRPPYKRRPNTSPADRPSTWNGPTAVRLNGTTWCRHVAMITTNRYREPQRDNTQGRYMCMLIRMLTGSI